MPDHLVVLITAGSVEEATRIAETLVAELLVACVNIIPGVTSVFRWHDEIQRDQEWLLVVKTRPEALDAVVRRVEALHSYQVPEIIALPIVGGSQAYLQWIDTVVHGAWHALG